MKKLLIILALCSMCICSCTSTPPAESPAESSTEATTTEATTEVEEMEKFEPTADNVIWGDKNGGVFNDALGHFGGKLELPLGFTGSDELAELIEAADEDDRLAVIFLSAYNGSEEVPEKGTIVLPFGSYKYYDKNSEEYSSAFDKYIDPFSRFPEGYKERYVFESPYICFAFMTPEEVSEIIINKNTGFMMDTVSYKDFLYWMGYYTEEELMTMTEE